MQKKLSIGNEVRVKTKDDQTYKGILLNIHKKHLSAIAALGVVWTIPLNMITQITKLS